MPSQAYVCYAMVPQMSFPLRIDPSNNLCWCFLLFCFLLSVSDVTTNGGLMVRFPSLQPFRVCPWQVYVPPVFGSWPMLAVHQVVAHSTAFSRACLKLLSCNPAIRVNMMGLTALVALHRVTHPPLSLHGEEGSFLCLVPSADMADFNLLWALNQVNAVW